MDGTVPARLVPALFAGNLPLPQVMELPEVVNTIQRPYLCEPCTDSLHDLTPSGNARTPMRFPFKKISRMKDIRTELKDSTEVARRCGRPERELLHQVGATAFQEFRKLLLEFLVDRGLEAVERAMIAGVSLVLPDVNFKQLVLPCFKMEGRLAHQRYPDRQPQSSSCPPDGTCCLGLLQSLDTYC